MLQQIGNYLSQQPFAPFEIRCTDGKSFLIDHPQHAVIFHDFIVIRLGDESGIATLHASYLAAIIASTPRPLSREARVVQPRSGTTGLQARHRDSHPLPARNCSLVVRNVF